MKSRTAPEVEQSDPILDAWNRDNPWIQNDSPKTAYAGYLYRKGISDGKTSQEIVDIVNREIEKEYPGTITGVTEVKPQVINARRGDPSTTQSGKTQTGSKKAGLNMSDLTGDEKNVRNRSTYLANMDDAKFLKLVEKTRASEAAE